MDADLDAEVVTTMKANSTILASGGTAAHKYKGFPPGQEAISEVDDDDDDDDHKDGIHDADLTPPELMRNSTEEDIAANEAAREPQRKGERKEKYKNFRSGSQPIIKEDDEFFLRSIKNAQIKED